MREENVKKFLMLGIALSIGGCSVLPTVYSGSRSEVQKVGDRSYVISYNGQVDSDAYMTGVFANFRTAQYVLANGFRYYTIPTSKTVMNTAEIYVSPDVYYYFTGRQDVNGRVSMMGYPISIGGGRKIESTPTAVNLVKVVDDQNDQSRNTYDAIEVCKKMAREHKLKC